MQNPMNNYETEVYTGEVLDAFPSRHGMGALMASRSTRMMLEEARLEAGNNRCRALLAKSAMEETGALATMASRLSKMAPQGSEFYYEILRAYAQKTVQKIERW